MLGRLVAYTQFEELGSAEKSRAVVKMTQGTTRLDRSFQRKDRTIGISTNSYNDVQHFTSLYRPYIEFIYKES